MKIRYPIAKKPTSSRCRYSSKTTLILICWRLPSLVGFTDRSFLVEQLGHFNPNASSL